MPGASVFMRGRPIVALGSFPRLYPWLLMVGAMDFLVTSLILQLGGDEVNLIAARALEAWGLVGLVAVKLLSLAVVVGCCEMLARRRAQRAQRTGRMVAATAVIVTCLPVAYGSAQLGQVLVIDRNPFMWEAILLSETMPQVLARHEASEALYSRYLVERKREQLEAKDAQRNEMTAKPSFEQATPLAPSALAAVAEE